MSNFELTLESEKQIYIYIYIKEGNLSYSNAGNFGEIKKSSLEVTIFSTDYRRSL